MSSEDESFDEKIPLNKITQNIGIIGPCKSGKTCIVNAIIDGNTTFNDIYSPTNLMGKIKKKIDIISKTEVTYNLYDFSGKIDNMSSVRFKISSYKCNGIIIVINMELNEYKETRNELIEWLDYFRDYASKFKRILLIGNKYDIYKASNIVKSTTIVDTKKDIKKISKEYGIKYKFVSAKNNKNIDRIISWLNDNTESIMSNPDGINTFAIDNLHVCYILYLNIY